MSALVDPAAGRVSLGDSSWPFELDLRTETVTIEVGGERLRLRQLRWREKLALARFAHLGQAFLERQLVRACVEDGVEPPDGPAASAVAALARWINQQDAALPLDGSLLAEVTMDVCRALGVRPADLDGRSAAEVEQLWQVAAAERAGAPARGRSAPTPAGFAGEADLRDGDDFTRVVIVPDPGEAAPRPDGQPAPRTADLAPTGAGTGERPSGQGTLPEPSPAADRPRVPDQPRVADPSLAGPAATGATSGAGPSGAGPSRSGRSGRPAVRRFQIIGAAGSPAGPGGAAGSGVPPLLGSPVEAPASDSGAASRPPSGAGDGQRDRIEGRGQPLRHAPRDTQVSGGAWATGRGRAGGPRTGGAAAEEAGTGRAGWSRRPGAPEIATAPPSGRANGTGRAPEGHVSGTAAWSAGPALSGGMAGPALGAANDVPVAPVARAGLGMPVAGWDRAAGVGAAPSGRGRAALTPATAEASGSRRQAGHALHPALPLAASGVIDGGPAGLPLDGQAGEGLTGAERDALFDELCERLEQAAADMGVDLEG